MGVGMSAEAAESEEVKEAKAVFGQWSTEMVRVAYQKASVLLGYDGLQQQQLTRAQFFSVFGVADIGEQNGHLVMLTGALPLSFFARFCEAARRGEVVADATKLTVSLLQIFLALAMYCHGDLEERVQFAFEAFDEDGNGIIDKDEMFVFLRTCMHVMHLVGGAKELPDDASVRDFTDVMFEEADEDHDGCLSPAEFYKWSQGSMLTKDLFDKFKKSTKKPKSPKGKKGVGSPTGSGASFGEDGDGSATSPEGAAPGLHKYEWGRAPSDTAIRMRAAREAREAATGDIKKLVREASYDIRGASTQLTKLKGYRLAGLARMMAAMTAARDRAKKRIAERELERARANVKVVGAKRLTDARPSEQEAEALKAHAAHAQGKPKGGAAAAMLRSATRYKLLEGQGATGGHAFASTLDRPTQSATASLFQHVLKDAAKQSFRSRNGSGGRGPETRGDGSSSDDDETEVEAMADDSVAGTPRRGAGRVADGGHRGRGDSAAPFRRAASSRRVIAAVRKLQARGGQAAVGKEAEAEAAEAAALRPHALRPSEVADRFVAAVDAESSPVRTTFASVAAEREASEVAAAAAAAEDKPGDATAVSDTAAPGQSAAAVTVTVGGRMRAPQPPKGVGFAAAYAADLRAGRVAPTMAELAGPPTSSSSSASSAMSHGGAATATQLGEAPPFGPGARARLEAAAGVTRNRPMSAAASRSPNSHDRRGRRPQSASDAVRRRPASASSSSRSSAPRPSSATASASAAPGSDPRSERPARSAAARPASASSTLEGGSSRRSPSARGAAADASAVRQRPASAAQHRPWARQQGHQRHASGLAQASATSSQVTAAREERRHARRWSSSSLRQPLRRDRVTSALMAAESVATGSVEYVDPLPWATQGRHTMAIAHGGASTRRSSRHSDGGPGDRSGRGSHVRSSFAGGFADDGASALLDGDDAVRDAGKHVTSPASVPPSGAAERMDGVGTPLVATVSGRVMRLGEGLVALPDAASGGSDGVIWSAWGPTHAGGQQPQRRPRSAGAMPPGGGVASNLSTSATRRPVRGVALARPPNATFAGGGRRHSQGHGHATSRTWVATAYARESGDGRQSLLRPRRASDDGGAAASRDRALYKPPRSAKHRRTQSARPAHRRDA
uniref:EF-hand domain-containing protein n=1 Tax=Bicosoecida sp. CB-2014 TaxID=1486930 RepID=A0A7S1GDS9_9STRA|mmetsp:Transcript_9452/g.33236  ORF Transcript_9452/g.33236 Transcript_9452/m.33236 type:complete len:1137 (+) Transcript_9452:686-4096(+)